MVQGDKQRKRLFRSVRREGGSTVITLGKDVLPDDFHTVSIKVISRDIEWDNRPSVTIKIEKIS